MDELVEDRVLAELHVTLDSFRDMVATAVPTAARREVVFVLPSAALTR